MIGFDLACATDEIVLNLDSTAEATGFAGPSIKDCDRYGIRRFTVLVSGPGGGNPELYVWFGGRDRRANALAFLDEWYGSTDVENDLATFLAGGDPGDPV